MLARGSAGRGSSGRGMYEDVEDEVLGLGVSWKGPGEEEAKSGIVGD